MPQRAVAKLELAIKVGEDGFTTAWSPGEVQAAISTSDTGGGVNLIASIEVAVTKNPSGFALYVCMAE